MKHLYTVRNAGLSKIFFNFYNNPMVLHILFFKWLSNVNLLSNVNPNASHLPLKSPLFYSGKITILTILTIE